MIDWHRLTATVVTSILAAACAGGSGSTGLILPESAVLDEVRRDGVCIASGSTTFCATGSPDAVAPGGATADGGDVFGGQTGRPCPVNVDGMCGDSRSGVFAVSGLPEGAACAIAARPAGDDGPWSTGALVVLGATSTSTAFPLPSDLGNGEVEIVLLCFESPPAALPATLESLLDAGADVAFVPDAA